MMTSNVVIFGEVLFDCFPDSVRVLGGAPFNVAWALQGFGQKPLFVSAVGNDEDGHAIRQKMEEWQITTEGLQVLPDHKTGEVIVTVKDNEPSYEICSPRAWDFITDEGHTASEIIYHGSLALRSTTNAICLSELIKRSEAVRFFDINLRPPHFELETLKKQIEGVEWLKLNIHELGMLLETESITFSDCEKKVDALRKSFSIENVILTSGSEGAFLSGSYGHSIIKPAPEVENFTDTVGAGDAFSAMAIDGILQNIPADQLLQRASDFAGQVCGIRGATSREPEFYTRLNYAEE